MESESLVDPFATSSFNNTRVHDICLQQNMQLQSNYMTGMFKKRQTKLIFGSSTDMTEKWHNTSILRTNAVGLSFVQASRTNVKRTFASERGDETSSIVNGNHKKKRQKQQNSKKSVTLLQTLDAGQRNIGPTYCKICDMYYHVGHPEDENIHKQRHADFVNGIRFSGWANERVVLRLPNGDRIVAVHGEQCAALSKRSAQCKKIVQILSTLNMELESADDDRELLHDQQLLIYIRKSHVAGCVVIKRIQQAFFVDSDENYDSIGDTTQKIALESKDSVVLNDMRDASLLFDSSQPVAASLGIDKIWVHRCDRRMGIASTLIDCARDVFVYGMTIPLNGIAFSQPTRLGRMLASSYCKTKKFLVYR